MKSTHDTLIETGQEGDLYGPVLGNGAQLGRWTVDERVAQGSFGHVYRGHDDAGRPGALKVLHQLFLHVPDVVKRFHREAEAVFMLRHPNIVQVLDFGELSDGRPYLAMEWLDGPTLDQAIDMGGPMPLSRTLDAMEGLCAGLAHAHKTGVVHRDLKGSNVMLVPAGGHRELAKLVDFGVAKLVDRVGTRITTTGVRVGTPSCMAPEQIRGTAVSAATDVYALGVMLHRMVTGKYPFHAENLVEMEAMHLHVAPPRPSDRVPEVACVDDVVLRAMAKEPSARFAEVEEFLTVLRAAICAPSTHAGARAESVSAVALYVSKPSPDLAARAAAEGLTVVRQSAYELLAVAQLPRHPRAERELRRKVMTLAFAFAKELRERSVAVEVGPATRVLDQGVTTFTGGELLATETWTSEQRGVMASEEVLAELDDRYMVLPGASGHMRVVIPRNPSSPGGL